MRCYAFGIRGYCGLQVPGNLLGIGTLEKLLELAAKKGVAIVVRQPFAQGHLLTHPALLEFVAKHPGRTPAQTALRFVLQLRGVGVVLTGMTSRSHLAENLGAVTAPPLTCDEMDILYGLSNMNDKRSRRMIANAESIAPGESLSCDVCVIGGGAAGITAALELGDAGLQVILLEAGGEEMGCPLPGPVQGDNSEPQYACTAG